MFKHKTNSQHVQSSTACSTYCIPLLIWNRESHFLFPLLVLPMPSPSVFKLLDFLTFSSLCFHVSPSETLLQLLSSGWTHSLPIFLTFSNHLCLLSSFPLLLADDHLSSQPGCCLPLSLLPQLSPQAIFTQGWLNLFFFLLQVCLHSSLFLLKERGNKFSSPRLYMHKNRQWQMKHVRHEQLLIRLQKSHRFVEKLRVYLNRFRSQKPQD